MSLDTKTVAKIANLARIRVSEENLEPLAGELNSILTFVEQLESVNTDGVEPMASVASMGLRQREDAITDGGYPERVLENGPETQMGFYTVPKVVE